MRIIQQIFITIPWWLYLIVFVVLLLEHPQ